jgi:secondary thiamine-phosphate synthase enzyme
MAPEKFASGPCRIQATSESCMQFDGETMQFTVKTRSQTELVDITASIQDVIQESGLEQGLCFVFVPHTTAAVTINESADPSVKSDMLKVINQVIPWEAGYRHVEGNSPAHIKSTLVGASALIAVEKGRLVLGTWQGVFFCEFDGPRTRKVNVNFLPCDKSIVTS